jgi:hypothetical protein
MKRTLLVILALVMTLTMVIGFAIPVGAAHHNDNGAVWNNGAYVDIHGNSVKGRITFEYGWNKNQFASPPVGYWIGIYDVTNSHYEWAVEKVFDKKAPRKLKQVSTTRNLEPGEYKIVFFVRGSYTPDVTNLAVIDGVNFTMR